MSGGFLYLLLKLDAIIYLFLWFMVPSCIIGCCAILFWIVLWLIPKSYESGNEWGNFPSEDEVKDCKMMCANLKKPVGRILMVVLPIFIISRIIVSLVPTTKQMAIIYVVPKVVNSEMVQEIPKKLLDLSKEWLEELSPKSVKKGKKTSDTESVPEKKD